MSEMMEKRTKRSNGNGFHLKNPKCFGCRSRIKRTERECRKIMTYTNGAPPVSFNHSSLASPFIVRLTYETTKNLKDIEEHREIR